VPGARLEIVDALGDTFSPEFWRRSREAFDRLHARRPFDVVLSEGSSGWGLLGAGVPILAVVHLFKGVHLFNSWQDVSGFRSFAGYGLATLPRILKDGLGQERPFFRRCERVVSVSHHVASRLRQSYGLRDVRVVWNWVDPAEFAASAERRESGRARWGLAEADFAFLCLNRLQRRKGADDAIIAFCRSFAGRASVKLIVTGGGTAEERGALETLARPAGSQIVFTGELLGESLIEAYDAADAFIYPSRYLEGLPYTLVEAMSVGLPIAATDRVSSRETLGDAALYFRSGEPDSIGRAMKTLLDGAEARRRLAEAARTRAALFSPERWVPRLAAELRETAALGPARAGGTRL
jgi:glycosyltransferase involved in cell wall biosynthesis